MKFSAFVWTLTNGILLFLPKSSTANISPSDFISECISNGTSRHVIEEESSGSLIFRPGSQKGPLRGTVPCQWFIDGTAFGTNILVNVSQLSGDCRFQSCIFLIDGDTLEDPLLASLPGSISRDFIAVTSSAAKFFIHIAAGCEGLRSFHATFRVLNCSGCTGNCSLAPSESDCDPQCPSVCTGESVSKAGVCADGSSICEICSSASSSADAECAIDTVPEIRQLWSTLDRTGVDRAGQSSVFINQTIWIYGGYNFFTALDRLDGYSITTGTWSSEKSQSEITPPARYLHSAVLLNDTMYIYGGLDASGIVLDDFWSFNFTSKIWTSVYNDVVPPLAAHSATLVGPQETYIFGGYQKDGSLSSSLYIWSAMSKTWILERPRNGEDPLAQMAAHSAVFYKPLNSLVIFGGVRSASAGVHFIFLYNVRDQLWTSMAPQYATNTLAPYSQLAFHRADVVGNYMIITGGYDVGNSRSCRHSSLHFYHLSCQIFLNRGFFEEKNLSIPDLNRFGHSTVLTDDHLYIYGGISDTLTQDMSSLSLPDFVASNGDHCVKEYSKRATCQADISCVWCPKSSDSESEEGLCVGSQNARIICGTSAVNPACSGLCPALTSCSSCLAYQQESHCTWCPQAAKCVLSTTNLREDCATKKAKEMVGWWTNKDLVNLETIEECQQPQTTSGLTVFLYQPSPDFNMPDEVNYVQTSVLSFRPIVRFPPNQDSGLLIVEMKGFIHPLGANPKSSWDTQLRMWVRAENSLGFEGIVQLWLSSDADPKNVDLVAESKGIFPIKTEVNHHDGSLLFPAVDDKYFVKFVYQMTVTRSRLQADFDVRLYLTWNGNSIVTQPFDVRNLEPFSTNGISCPKYNNCLLCLADMSCGWCPASNKCISRSPENALGTTCQRADGTPVLLKVDFSQCTDCSVVNDASVCNKEDHCRWDIPARSCLRSSLVPIERTISTQPDCTKLKSCSGCVQSQDKCVWCHSTGQCLPRSALSIVLAFGQCRFWENNNVAAACTQCREIKECDACLSRPHCGWCSRTGKDPRQGVCLDGNSQGSTEADDNSACPVHDLVNGNETVLSSSWSFSSCPDVDECALGMADCHQNATCINTRGHYTCKCAEGYKGDGRTTCMKTCDQPCIHGKCSDEVMPTLEPFKCICDLGWTGAQCDIDCGCNFHSTCLKNVTQCDQCYGNTEGQFCERCVKGTFGNATEDSACMPCSCNGHADPNQPCDSSTGKCHCEFPYQGKNCEKCPSDFYGDPLNGGLCYSRCRSRTVIINATSGGLGNLNDTSDSICLWLLVSGRTDYFGDRLPITLTILPTMEVACPNNSIIVTDGFPNFLVSPEISTDLSTDDARLFDLWENSNRPSQILGKICGPLDSAISITAKSGVLTVMLWKSSRVERFNATYRTEDEHFSRKKRDFPSDQLNSRIGFVAQGAKKAAFLFAGLDPLEGVLGDLWTTTRDTLATTGWSKVDLRNGIQPLPRYFHASCVVEDGLLIHGGFVQNADRIQIGSDVWLFSATRRTWRELPVRNAPRLAGHTMTVIKDIVYIIGGAATAFSDNVYTFKLTEWQWRVLPANGSRPPGLYGHSATYYPIRNAIFVFGGYRFDLDSTGMSNIMSVLDLNRRRWIMMPSTRTDVPLGPSPRMFHAAKYISQGQYMIVAGGRTPSQLFDQSLLIYRFRCNGWLDDSGPNKTALYKPAFIDLMNESDSITYLVSGYAYSQPHVRVTEVPAVSDFCPRYASTQQCLSVTGCGMCATESGNGSFCFDNSVGDVVRCGDSKERYNVFPGMSCDENLSVMRICREQTECRTCVAPWIGVGEEESRCHWCTNCGNGVCIARYEYCEASLSCNKSNTVVRDPGRCLDEQCHAADCQRCHDSRLSCFWTRNFDRLTEVHVESRRSPAYPWNCFPQELLRIAPLSVESRDSVLAATDCPSVCSRFESCTDCLGAPGAAGGSQRCIWSMDGQECLEPGLVPLRCPLGNCGALLYGWSRDRCPKDPKSVAVCRECLRSSQTGWCALDGSNGQGTCLFGGISGPVAGSCSTSSNLTKTLVTAVEVDHKKTKSLPVPSHLAEDALSLRHTWHFLTCPSENECLNGHHTCDDKSEECHDTLQGFNCTCKTGYVPVSLTATPDTPSRCDPVCSQGCKNGRCVEPETCDCQFGFVGLNCSTACQCNGHSQCPGQHELTTCTQCTNNTYGTHCEKCQEGFVGDARNGGTCQSCTSYCNGHATLCITLSQIFNASSDTPFLPDNPFQGFDFLTLKNTLDRDRTSNLALCNKCGGNTTGIRCESCLPGFFRPPPYSTPKDMCRACECNGHDNTCNALTGTNCKCQNNTATDPACDGNDKKELPNGTPCWTVQCAQCKEYFVGKPTHGHQCYRQLSVGEDHCFDPEIPRGRCAYGDALKPLRQGRTVFFAVQPKFVNVDIRIYVDVTVGGVDLYISDQEDMFTVSVDHKTGFHFVQVDKKYMAYSRGIDDVVDFHRATDVMTFVSAADPAKVVILRDIRNRAILTIPYTEYDLKQSKFYVVVHGIGGPTSDMTKGRILFRQDQPHIDLFVFFSVFFSCFFLFLAVCIVLWKFKHVYGVRQTRQRVAIELQTMASRPFGSVYLVFQRRSPQARPVSVLTIGLAALPAEPSTSADLRKSLAKNGKRKKRNVVDPHEALSPSSSLGLDAPPNKNPKLMPMAMEFLHGGAAAVATFAMELPGDQDCPVRFCLASTLVTAPQIYAHFNVKN